MKSDPKTSSVPSADSEPVGLRVEDVRESLVGKSGPEYWRSLDELAGTDEFAELIHREFPQMLPVEGANTSRRRFLQLMGASLALAGLNACSIQPEERMLPYTKQPEEIIPGKPLFFASAHPHGAFGRGLLVESHMGRPTKIEGNPDHPSSRGATDVFDQAAVLDLYDPDRAQIPQERGTLRSWNGFAGDLQNLLSAQRGLQGEGLRIVMETTTSPTVLRLVDRIASELPKAQVVWFDPAGHGLARDAAAAAFGAPTHVHYDLSAADVVVTLDSDLLTEGPGAVAYARDFADNRRVVEDDHHMNRLYAVESSPTNTGVLADHRLSLAPARLERFAVALASALGVDGVNGSADSDVQAWVQAIARDLRAHAGSSLVVAGENAPRELQILAHAINASLGNLGRTVRLTAPVLPEGPAGAEGLRTLVGDLERGVVDALFLVGGNPLFDAPADVDLASAMERAPLRIRMSTYEDETSLDCHWHIPMSHFLESWGDVRAFDGSPMVVQPLIQPLYESRTPAQLLALILGDAAASDYDLVQETWRTQVSGNFTRTWRRWLHDGAIGVGTPGTILRSVDTSAVARAARTLGSGTGTSVVFRPDPTIGDGRWSNNAWLQECPKPHTRITWDNCALMSPRLAESLDVSNEEMVRISAGDRQIDVAAWILPGHADDTITLHLGYGRTSSGRIGDGCGFDVTPLRTSDDWWRVDDVRVEGLGRTYRLATTQTHHSMEGRHLVQHTTLDDMHHGHGDGEHHGNPMHHGIDIDASLMPGHEYDGYKWGMVVDLSSCTGCNACVVACHSENNIAIVGKNEVLNGRELHWMRIDRYFEGDLDQPATYLQPVMCQHCEQAPCEVVCPVAATVHTDEGINTMAYNRCVGTRYCANNCPYKVRRFNFYQYADQKTESLKLGRNPDVTVRHRGVMEKCTYCIQRTQSAKIEATVKEIPLSEVGLQSACQQACPTGAIAFGDMNDSQSKVAQWKESNLEYGILQELGTRPRTTYLKRVSNPNPELARS